MKPISIVLFLGVLAAACEVLEPSYYVGDRQMEAVSLAARISGMVSGELVREPAQNCQLSSGEDVRLLVRRRLEARPIRSGIDPDDALISAYFEEGAFSNSLLAGTCVWTVLPIDAVSSCGEEVPHVVGGFCSRVDESSKVVLSTTRETFEEPARLAGIFPLEAEPD